MLLDPFPFTPAISIITPSGQPNLAARHAHWTQDTTPYNQIRIKNPDRSV